MPVTGARALGCGALLILVPLLPGCVSTEVSSFSPSVDQSAITRDGMAALVSRKPSSIVLIRQAQRQKEAGARPAYVIGILNTSKAPINFAFSGIAVTQTVAGVGPKTLKTYSYDELVREEKQRQVAAAILVGLAGAASVAAASNSGYYSGSGTVSGAYGTAHISYSGYDATAAAIAQTNASIQNQAMIESAVETGRNNLANLENGIIKDNTVFPGEWYGGVVQFDPPAGTWPKTFQVSVTVGGDVHDISITQTLPKP
jgi:hypothetical protein